MRILTLVDGALMKWPTLECHVGGAAADSDAGCLLVEVSGHSAAGGQPQHATENQKISHCYRPSFAALAQLIFPAGSAHPTAS